MSFLKKVTTYAEVPLSLKYIVLKLSDNEFFYFTLSDLENYKGTLTLRTSSVSIDIEGPELFTRLKKITGSTFKITGFQRNPDPNKRDTYFLKLIDRLRLQFNGDEEDPRLSDVKKEDFIKEEFFRQAEPSIPFVRKGLFLGQEQWLFQSSDPEDFKYFLLRGNEIEDLDSIQKYNRAVPQDFKNKWIAFTTEEKDISKSFILTQPNPNTGLMANVWSITSAVGLTKKVESPYSPVLKLYPYRTGTGNVGLFSPLVREPRNKPYFILETIWKRLLHLILSEKLPKLLINNEKKLYLRELKIDIGSFSIVKNKERTTLLLDNQSQELYALSEDDLLQIFDTPLFNTIKFTFTTKEVLYGTILDTVIILDNDDELRVLPQRYENVDDKKDGTMIGLRKIETETDPELKGKVGRVTAIYKI